AMFIFLRNRDEPLFIRLRDGTMIADEDDNERLGIAIIGQSVPLAVDPRQFAPFRRRIADIEDFVELRLPREGRCRMSDRHSDNARAGEETSPGGGPFGRFGRLGPRRLFPRPSHFNPPSRPPSPRCPPLPPPRLRLSTRPTSSRPGPRRR